jgi:ribosomal subunit interface protein
MPTTIKATNMDLSQAISDYVTKRVDSLEKVLPIHDPAVVVRVEVGKTTEHHKQGDVFRAEIHIEAYGKDYYAKSTQDDLYAAIDEVRDEMFRQVRRTKNRMRDLFIRGARSLKKRVKGFKPWGKGQQ